MSWKSSGQTISYDEALKEYKNGNYEITIAISEKILAQKEPQDPTIMAYTLQLLTASCIETENHEKGLQYIDKEIAGFEKASGSGRNFPEALKKKAGFLLMAGKPLDAARMYHDIGVYYSKLNGENSYEYFKANASEAEALIEAGKLSDSGKLFEIALKGFKNNPDAAEDYLYALFYTGYLLNVDNKFQEAGTRLTEFISLAEANSLQGIPEYEQAKKIISGLNSKGKATAGGPLIPEDLAKQSLTAGVKYHDSSPDEALKAYGQCQKTIEENKIINNTSYSCYLNHGRLLYSLNRLPEASVIAERAGEHAQKLFGPESPETAYVQILQADIALKHNKKSEAVALYTSAISNLEKGPVDIFPKHARWITGMLLADDLSGEAAVLASKAIGHPRFFEFTARDKIGLYTQYGNALLNSRKVEALQNELQQKVSSEKDVQLKQCFYLLLARAAFEENDLNGAAENLRLALATAPSGLLAAEALYESARVYYRLGNFREAELNFRKAASLAPGSFEPASLTPQIYNSFANFYIDLGNYAEAEKLYTRLLSEKNIDNAFNTTVLQNLAALYEQTGKYSQAKKLLREAVESDRRLLGEQHPDYAISLQNLAALYQKTGITDSAKLLFEKALLIDKDLFGDQSVSYASRLANLAAVHQDMNDFAKARQMLEASLAIRKKLLAPQHPEYAFNLYSLGNLLYRTGKSTEALPYFREAARLYIRQIKDVFTVQSDYERTAFYNKVQDVINGFQLFAVENFRLHETLPGELLNFRLETKALLLSSSVKVRNQIMASGDPQLISNFAAWQRTKEQLAYLYTLDNEERMMKNDLIATYTQQANDLEKLLTAQSYNFASSFDSKPPDWTQIQAMLKPGECAVEILRVDRPGPDSVIYAALIVKPGLKQPEVVIIPDGSVLESRSFKRYMNSIRYHFVDQYPYEIFWKDIDILLKGVKTVYLSPDGVYNKVNCLTFYDAAKDEYVVDRLNIQLVSNLKDLLEKPHAEDAQKQAVVVGFPDYRLSTQPRSALNHVTRSANPFSMIAMNGIPDLPGTGEEVTRIREVLTRYQWNVSFNTRQQASEETIKSLKDPTILHIATHGFFIAPPAGESPEISGGDLANAANNRMLRSGLLLAGAEKNLLEKFSGQSGSKSEDGVLTAYEVMNLNLDKTKMVILSACETGRGDVRNGEGVYGLQRAFRLAGAENLIMSLWKVDDNATQEMMTDFYPRWMESPDKQIAFYDTVLEMKKKYSFPYYWGAFVMVGKP